MKLKIPFNYDNFCKLQDEVEELRDLTLKLNSRIILQESKPKKVEKKETKNVDKQ